MSVKFFWKSDCPKCPAAKERITEVDQVEFFNLDEPTGLAEAAFYSVMATPSVVISRPDGSEVVSFRGDVPPNEELARWL